ncbi:hypothetical protein ACFYO7_32430 [Nocardia salmonicida]|uniref:hypothetical protein n=1 Tax=Nocardia salmonicida TaxID=53431 RepID=UPI0036D1F66B
MTRRSKNSDDHRYDQQIDLLVWQEVNRIRTEWVVDPRIPLAERTTRIDEEAAALTHRIELLADRILVDLIEGWIAAYRNLRPPADIVTNFANAARADARRQVLCTELYALIPPESFAPQRCTPPKCDTHRPQTLSQRYDPRRWQQRITTTSPLVESIVLRTWGTIHSADFTLLALALVHVRLQDGLPTPVTPLDPLAEELTALIYEQLVTEGLPPA